jgi:hypothetical protein
MEELKECTRINPIEEPGTKKKNWVPDLLAMK